MRFGARLAIGLAITFVVGTSAASGSAIQAISICGAGTVANAGCTNGTADTQQAVLAQGTGNPINSLVGAAPDEHSSVLPIGNAGYLFFLATGVNGVNPDVGAVALTATAPSPTGQWSLGFASGYGQYPAGQGDVFLAPTAEVLCPRHRNYKLQDRTFDLDYAAPGQVVADPTDRSGNRMLMVYEGANTCLGSTGGKRPERKHGIPDSYISIGIATSSDRGMTWPSYAAAKGFSFVPLPNANKTQGPNAGLGVFGPGLCIGTTCGQPTPYPAYGRYAVLSPRYTLTDAAVYIARHGGYLDEKMGDAQPSAFVQPGKPSWLYVVHDYAPGGDGHPGGLDPLPGHRQHDLAIARAPLTGDQNRLLFLKWAHGKWTGPASGQTENTGDESPILKAGKSSNAFKHCEDVDPPSAGATPPEARSGGSISYVASTGQYLLLFTCTSSQGDPELGPNPKGGSGVAWFYATTFNLNKQQWSHPHEVIGSWNQFQPGTTDGYSGWYPTLMSLGSPQGRLGDAGFAFYLNGCESAGTGCPPRVFSSRQFTIKTTSNGYGNPPTTTISGPGAATVLPGQTAALSFTLASSEPSSAIECAFGSAKLTACPATVSGRFRIGTYTLRARSINPFNVAGPIATWTFSVSPLTPCRPTPCI
jgi:hypothetical protein